LQSTRMALHAIKAGEGQVFISAGWRPSRATARAAPTHFQTRSDLCRCAGAHQEIGPGRSAVDRSP
jgi:hypothetical protein